MKKAFDWKIIIPLSLVPAIESAEEIISTSKKPIEVFLIEKGLTAIAKKQCKLGDHKEYGGEKGVSYLIPKGANDIRSCLASIVFTLGAKDEQQALFLALIHALKEITGREYVAQETNPLLAQVVNVSIEKGPPREVFIGTPIVPGETQILGEATFCHRMACSCKKVVDVPHALWKELKSRPSKPVCSECRPATDVPLVAVA